jgi:hypothetical protein
LKTSIPLSMSVASEDQSIGTRLNPIPNTARSTTHAGGGLTGIKERWRTAPLLSYPSREEWPSSLQRARLVGFAVLTVQLVLLCWWSAVLIHRFAVTKDFAAYTQAEYLIGHGHLDPYSTVFRVQFWRNAAEFLVWPLALIVRVWPALTTLPWLQDLALVGAEAVAFSWICEIAAERTHRSRESVALVIVALGLVLLIGNPWIVWTVSFDVHLEPFIALFIVCAAKDLYRGRRRAWLWAALAISCGVVGATYVVGLGVSAALSGRRWWRVGVGLAALGLAWFLFLQAVHGSQASGALEYSYLYTGQWNGPVPRGLTGTEIVKAAVTHPGRIIYALWHNGLNMWASVSPGGVIGLLWLPLLVPIVLIAIEGGLSIPQFSRPGFQSIAIGPLIAVATIALLAVGLASSRKRKRMVTAVVMALLLANALTWSIVWLPEVSRTWLTVNKTTASTLANVERKIGKNDEVIASQGIMGPFGKRNYVYTLFPRTMTVPVHTHRVWIVIVPSQGIEDPAAHGFYGEIGVLNSMPSMHLTVARRGVWAYEWTPPSHTRSLTIPVSDSTVAPAWTLTGPAGERVRNGSATGWYVTSTKQRGYVLNRALWREPAGRYRASATLSVSGRAEVEVWNDDARTLLARRVVRNSSGRIQVHMDFDLANAVTARVPTGWGPWSITPQRPNGDDLEIRVWTPGKNNVVSVYGVSLAPLTNTG